MSASAPSDHVGDDEEVLAEHNEDSESEPEPDYEDTPEVADDDDDDELSQEDAGAAEGTGEERDDEVGSSSELAEGEGGEEEHDDDDEGSASAPEEAQPVNAPARVVPGVMAAAPADNAAVVYPPGRVPTVVQPPDRSSAPRAADALNGASTEVFMRGRGAAALASCLQCALLREALAELGLRGPAAVGVWCRGLGLLGMSSVRARELFETLDVDRTGTVAPSAFCEADLSQEAMVDSLQSSLDLVSFVQLRYRLMLLGCRARFGLAVGGSLRPCEVVSLCAQLHLVIDEDDAACLIRDMMERGVLCGCRSGENEMSIPLGSLCHQLAGLSTSAPKLHTYSPSLSPQSNEGTPAPSPYERFTDGPGAKAVGIGPHADADTSRPQPAAYIGKTPLEIVVQFKDPATFPWHRLPESTCGRRFEELWQLAHQSRHQVAEEVLQLLTDPALDVRHTRPP